MSIGEKLVQLRKSKNLTQKEVAENIGVSYQAVSKWERNENLPDALLLVQIADLYEVTVDELLRGGSLLSASPKEDSNISTIEEDIASIKRITNRLFSDSSKENIASVIYFIGVFFFVLGITIFDWGFYSWISLIVCFSTVQLFED